MYIPRVAVVFMKRIAHGDRCVNRSPVPLVDPAKRADLRTDLAAANARLIALRAARKTSAAATNRSEQDVAVSAEMPAIPSHLGWHSSRFSTSSPEETQAEESTERAFNLSVISVGKGEPPQKSLTPTSSTTLQVYPTLLTAILKSEQAAAARVWLLCRYLDQTGRGWLSVETMRAQLTKNGSPLRVIGWRRLRQILQTGQNQFWERDGEGRIWLYGQRKVCVQFGVTRLTERRVALPLTKLLGSIGTVRAAFYASFHAGRDSNPISRQTIADIAGVSERVQRDYDRRMGVDIRPNFTIVSEFSAETQRDQTYQTGVAHFTLTDHKGRWGRKSARYNARQLPNSYQLNWQQAKTNQRKKLNQQLKQDLALNRTQGNSFSNPSWQRVFVANAQLAKGGSVGVQFVQDTASKTQTAFWIQVKDLGLNKVRKLTSVGVSELLLAK